ncbi:MAG: DUF354 domain-containing protein [Bacteroidales bacterium]|jgi:predicted glycosyltransferase|nr:DUF354 domain-containing protein [Bacteroidales bacterium]
MKIIIDIYHPARVHLYKNFIWEMEKRGHEILVTASDKDVIKYLLDCYNFNHHVIGAYGKTLSEKLVNIPLLDYRMYKIAKKFNPDILIGSVRAGHVSKILRKPTINFDDDGYGFSLNYPFLDALVGFSGFKKEGKKIIKINGYKELAYLGDGYYKPNPDIIRSIGISPNEEFVLLRFVEWSAYHDIGKRGFTIESRKKLIHELEKYARVFISSESRLPPELQKYKIPVPPESIHDLLHYAKLFVSDSQTMTTEAAILGTPAIRSNSFVGNYDMHNFTELEMRYNLIYNFKEADEAIQQAIELVQQEGLKEIWHDRRKKLLEEKIDVTKFMIWFIENYPQSFKDMREHPEIQYSCPTLE